MRFLLCLRSARSVLPRACAEAAALERGAAIIDPLALARTRPRPIWPRPHAAAGAIGRYRRSPTANCSRCRRWCRSARRSTPSSIATSQGTRPSLPNETIGVGDAFDFQLFDRALLYSPDTRFVLAGIVNRMDRAYVAEADCGEIRLIYRLTRTDAPATRRGRGLAAAADDAERRAEGQGRCRDRRKRRSRSPAPRSRAAGLPPASLPLTGAELAEKLTAKDGPLDLIGPKISTASKPIFRSRMRRNRRCAISAPTIC